MSLYTSLHGLRLGLGELGQLVTRSSGVDVNISQPCVGATITVGAEVTNVRAITIQLTDANGNDIDYAEEVDVNVFLSADRLAAVVTGGSTGIEIGTDGWIHTAQAKKRFIVTSEADGDIDLTWTDTGTEVAYIGVKLPNGRYVMSDALTNA